jgi:hypothetical protein
MPRLFGREFTRQQLMERVGSVDQVGGARLIKLAEGNEADALAALCRTGTGLSFIVNLNRGMDIAAAEYQGASLCWRSHCGDANSAYFEPFGFGWLRTFYGGLLNTCGATYCGSPVEDFGSFEGGPTHRCACGDDACGCEWQPTGSLGLHGRAAHTPAKSLCVDGRWDGDDYEFWVQGRMREAMVFGPNVTISRRISGRLGESRIVLHDVVTNEGWEPQEHMYLYHVNLGFPVVDEGGEYIFPAEETMPRTDLAASHQDTWSQFPAPIPHETEWVYYHKCRGADDGTAYAAFVNRAYRDGRGIGVYVRWNLRQMPWLIQWKMPAQGHYVTAIEPATNLVDGRVKEREEGCLTVLQPQESRGYDLEIGVLACRDEIEAMVARIRG